MFNIFYLFKIYVSSHLQYTSQIFVLFEEWPVIFTFIYQLFQIHFPINSLSHFLSHLNIISSFIIYYFFNNYTSSNIFLFNTLIIIVEKKIWRMNSSYQTWWATVH